MLSVGFNITVLMLWYTDFGSAPVELDGRIAERRLKRARDLSRTGTFVAHMDEEMLQNMTRDQLRGVADRAMRRATAVSGEQAIKRVLVETRLVLRTTNAPLARRSVEPRLEEFVKGWRFSGSTMHPMEDGAPPVTELEYLVQLRRRVSADDLLAALTGSALPEVLSVEVH